MQYESFVFFAQNLFNSKNEKNAVYATNSRIKSGSKKYQHEHEIANCNQQNLRPKKNEELYGDNVNVLTHFRTKKPNRIKLNERSKVWYGVRCETF